MRNSHYSLAQISFVTIYSSPTRFFDNANPEIPVRVEVSPFNIIPPAFSFVIGEEYLSTEYHISIE